MSSIWKRVLKVKNRAEACTKWIIGKGDVNFWKDRWCGEERLNDFAVNAAPQNCSVKDTSGFE